MLTKGTTRFKDLTYFFSKISAAVLLLLSLLGTNTAFSSALMSSEGAAYQLTEDPNFSATFSCTQHFFSPKDLDKFPSELKESESFQEVQRVLVRDLDQIVFPGEFDLLDPDGYLPQNRIRMSNTGFGYEIGIPEFFLPFNFGQEMQPAPVEYLAAKMMQKFNYYPDAPSKETLAEYDKLGSEEVNRLCDNEPGMPSFVCFRQKLKDSLTNPKENIRSFFNYRMEIEWVKNEPALKQMATFVFYFDYKIDLGDDFFDEANGSLRFDLQSASAAGALADEPARFTSVDHRSTLAPDLGLNEPVDLERNAKCLLQVNN